MMLPEIERLIRSFLLPKRCDGLYAVCLRCIKDAYFITNEFNLPTKDLISRAKENADYMKNMFIKCGMWEDTKYFAYKHQT